jgi:hypothetical protein
MMMKRKGFSWKQSWYYPGIHLEGLGKTAKTLNQDSRGRNLKPGPPEYEA